MCNCVVINACIIYIYIYAYFAICLRRCDDFFHGFYVERYVVSDGDALVFQSHDLHAVILYFACTLYTQIYIH